MVFHVVLISVLIIIPLLMPQRISQARLSRCSCRHWNRRRPRFLRRCSSVQLPSLCRPSRDYRSTMSPDALVMPIVIPTEVARVVDAPIVPDTGVVGGVPGGVPGGLPGGVTGGIIGGILSANTNVNPLPAVAPPSPPPPPQWRCPRQSRFALVVL